MKPSNFLRIVGLVIPPIMWALVIIPSAAIIHTYSTFGIAFIRFLIVGLISSSLGFVFILFFRIKPEKGILKKSIVPGFLLAFNILTYYMAFALTGAILTEVLVNVLPVIIVTLAEKKWGDMEMPPMKAIYVTLLALSGILVTLSRMEATSINGLGVVMIFLSAFSWCFILGHAAEMNIGETDKDKLTRVIFQFGIETLLTAFFLIPLGFITLIFPGWLGEQALQFISEIHSLRVFEIAADPNISISIFMNTLLPYFTLYLTGTYWNRKDFPYIQATAVAAPLEPLAAAILGWIVLGEHVIAEIMSLAIFMLLLALITVYLHENYETLLVTIILRPKQPRQIKDVFQKYRPYVVEIIHVLGMYSYLVKMRVKSLGSLRKIQNEVSRISKNEEYVFLIHRKNEKID